MLLSIISNTASATAEHAAAPEVLGEPVDPLPRDAAIGALHRQQGEVRVASGLGTPQLLSVMTGIGTVPRCRCAPQALPTAPSR